MPQNSSSAPTALKFTSFKEAQSFFGPPPILSTEDPEAYLALGQAVWDARSPQDFIEVTWINDITYYLWEGFRLRRMKLHLIGAQRLEAAQALMRQVTVVSADLPFKEAFWQRWLSGEEDSVGLVSALLKQSGLTDEAIVARAAEQMIDTLEKIEQQSAQFEVRRLTALRESEFYRENAELRHERAAQRRHLNGKGHGISVTVKDKNSGGSPKLNLSFDASQ